MYDGLQHGWAAPYGSAALALNDGMGATVNAAEINSIVQLKSNLRGDLRDLYEGAPRKPLTEFLPGPAFLLAGLWQAVPIYNFVPLLIAQAVIDSLLIAAFAFLLAHKNRVLAVLTALVMGVNLPVIKRTLMMGYDFWPQFSVLVLFVGVLALARWKYRPWMFLAIGLLVSVPIWCRDLTTPLPFLVGLVLIYVLRAKEGFSWPASLGRSTLLVGRGPSRSPCSPCSATK